MASLPVRRKLIYTDEVKGEVKKMLKIDEKDDIKQLTLADMEGVKGKKNEGEQIAVYYAYGEIVDSERSFQPSTSPR